MTGRFDPLVVFLDEHSFRPVLGIHGHIHESGGERRSGDTLCVNAGSEANHGVLRGYLIDLTADGVERSLRVEG